MVSVIGLGKNCCSLEVCSSNVGGSGWKAMVVFCHKAETIPQQRIRSFRFHFVANFGDNDTTNSNSKFPNKIKSASPNSSRNILSLSL